jgi:predicted ribosome quality control (RQC) complex YloA/Tae2 family protein
MDIDYTCSAGKNAELKYQERDRFKKKLKGLYLAIDETKKKLYNLENKIKKESNDVNIQKKVKLNKQWYSKFKYFFTSNNFLVLAGKDTRNNELLIKKYMEKEDIYFHADIHGAPHTILKSKGKEVFIQDKIEAAEFAFIHSSAWKNKLFSVDVYSVSSKQVTKTPNTGESLGTGAFVIRGKREYFRKLQLKIAVYLHNNEIIGAPLSATKAHTNKYISIVPGNLKKSDVTKEIKKIFEKENIKLITEQIDSVLPPGNSDLEK